MSVTLSFCGPLGDILGGLGGLLAELPTWSLELANLIPLV